MPIFTRAADTGIWTPAPEAAGPFGGVGGGLIAGLLTGEIESLAAERGWGVGASTSCWFLRPTPMGPLRSEVSVVRAGGRVAVIDNTLRPVDDERPCAMARVTLVRDEPREAPGFVPAPEEAVEPANFPLNDRPPMVSGPWFMDTMEVRVGGGASWFRMKDQVVEGAGPLSQALCPADLAHGIARPVQWVLADPNPNLTVHLLRPPNGGWIGLKSMAQWAPELGRGFGGASLHDPRGQIGFVSMGIVLTPFPGFGQAAGSRQREIA